MSILAPSLGPPLHGHTNKNLEAAAGITLQSGSRAVSPGQTMTETVPVNSHLYPACLPKSAPKSKIPCVTLETDVITDAMAARLAMSLLGHILFMKSQVPFPVIQLARMPSGKQSNTRALKKKAHLLTSFDTLASHLHTTFTALSTAMARSNKYFTTTTNIPVTAPQQAPSKFDDTGFGQRGKKKLGRAYLAVVFGSSASSAKARVFFAVDGLEVKIWGQRDDILDLRYESADESEEDSDEEETESDGSNDGSDSDSNSGSDSESDWVEELGSSTDSIIDVPPQSRSPSSPPSSPSDLEALTAQRSPAATPIPQVPSHAGDELPDSGVGTVAYASEQQAFLKAERLLSRTLATACAEGDGRGMTCELAPTQVHILLRAPRRFSHPAWTPKQNLGTTMEGALTGFLEESGLVPVNDIGSNSADRTKKKKGIESEGIWIRCRDLGDDCNRREGEMKEEDEEDEMIWWTWDGKIVGFADW